MYLLQFTSPSVKAATAVGFCLARYVKTISCTVYLNLLFRLTFTHLQVLLSTHSRYHFNRPDPAELFNLKEAWQKCFK